MLSNKSIIDYFKLPENFVKINTHGELSNTNGYFKFDDLKLYGRSSSGYISISREEDLYDVSQDIFTDNSAVYLSFQLDEIINNFYYERYLENSIVNSTTLFNRSLRNGYYLLRPLMPVQIRKYLQKISLRNWENSTFPRFPIDLTVEKIFRKVLILFMQSQKMTEVPFIWFWPKGYESALIMTHDVETKKGFNFCTKLIEMDLSYGLKSSFELIPERKYILNPQILKYIQNRNCEICIHGLNHDGKLFFKREIFQERIRKINEYAKQYGATGFRSPVMYRNLDWFDEFDFQYDMSVPNNGSLDPQKGGCCSVFPYFAKNILELPLTTTQDYPLFYLMNINPVELWKQQIKSTLDYNGLISFNMHPDYLISNKNREIYEQLLEYINNNT